MADQRLEEIRAYTTDRSLWLHGKGEAENTKLYYALVELLAILDALTRRAEAAEAVISEFEKCNVFPPVGVDWRSYVDWRPYPKLRLTYETLQQAKAEFEKVVNNARS